MQPRIPNSGRRQGASGFTPEKQTVAANRLWAPGTDDIWSRLSVWKIVDGKRILLYFSGKGTYTKTLQAPADWFTHGARLWLDLGDVRNLAVVTVNGQQLPTAWHAPYRVDVTAALKPGANQISITVINAWINRLIGDLQPDAKIKYTFTTWPVYKKDSPLAASGLIGPVTILAGRAH